jgi:hypothetical protein
MIIFLLLFFIIYFTIKIFVSSDYFNKLDGLDKILFVSIFLLIIWILITLYYLYCFLYGFIYLTTEKHQFYTETFIEDILHNNIFPRILFILSIILLVILYIFLHIFGFWIIIILFVPFIIIVPIPIIPFILPIPLKYLLLLPFQKLTDRGILPLMRRLLFGFFNEKTTKHLINSYYNITDFFYDNLKELINDFIIINEPRNEKISKGLQDDKYKTSTIDDENEETSRDIIKNESDNTKMKDKIKEEYLLCVKSRKGMNKFGEDINISNMFNDIKSDFECNFENLKTYMKIKI